ncbi:MAG: RNA polymerase sigma factor [Planctomycetes bacterium]|nr:RNA polymerase sigma factor [Planctomycetota bacterium]
MPRDKNDYDIAKLMAHDELEWQDLQADYFRRIYYYVKRHVGSADAAEDVTSETFLGALRGIARFDERYNVEQFLFGIARKKAIDWLRKSGHEVKIGSQDEDMPDYFGTVPDRAPTPSQQSIAREKVTRQRGALVEILKGYVGDLWEAQDFKRLKTIELVFLKNWKHRPIADLLDYQDEKAIAGVKFRAIRDFQDRLRRRDPNRSLFSKLWD